MLERLGPQLLQRLGQTESEIQEAEGLIQLMIDAGEDVSELEAALQAMVLRRDRWRGALSARGISEVEPSG